VVPARQAATAALAGLLEPLESPPVCDALPDWLLDHQADAVVRARAILRRFGGVLVSDGVGLGKTYVALALALLERQRGGDAVAFVPAALRVEWRRAAAAVGVPLATYSHTALSRRPPTLARRCSLLIVDEAHAFRNPGTRRYDALARLAVARRVALLTATPLNNTPADLAALVHLFAPRDRFREFGIANLEEALQCGEPAAALALGALSVCRTRRLVEERFPDLRSAFPRRVLQPPVRYDLDACYDGHLAELLDVLALLGREPADRGAALVLLGLLRRLESSRSALRRSLARHRDVLDEIARAAQQGVRVTRQEVRRVAGDVTQYGLWPLLGSNSSSGPSGGGLEITRHAISRALALTDAAAAVPDAKLNALQRLLTGPMQGARTIVFTEYRDTALHLLRHLRRHLRVIAVVGDAAWAGTTALSRREALDAFAPLGRARAPGALLEADVLVATDVASEGLNLQDAAAVVNYDLPWNPVRVMQRVGRIERLYSPHPAVHVAHLIPAGGLRDVTSVLRVLREKLTASSRAAGAEPDPLAALWWIDSAPEPEALERESWRRVAPFEARERWRALAGRDTRRHRAPAIGAAIAAEGPAVVGVLLALEWRDGCRVPLPFVMEGVGPARLDPVGFGELATRALDARDIPSDAGEFTGVLATVLPEARARLVAVSATRHGSPAPGPGRRTAAVLLERYVHEAHAKRAECVQAAHVLERLGHDLTAGVDRLLARLVRMAGSPRELAARCDELLASLTPPPGVALDRPPRLVLVAAILLATQCPSDCAREYLSACAIPRSSSTSTAPSSTPSS